LSNDVDFASRNDTYEMYCLLLFSCCPCFLVPILTKLTIINQEIPFADRL
ncbi:unnamed protein product, partial [Heterotrigona itama]